MAQPASPAHLRLVSSRAAALAPADPPALTIEFHPGAWIRYKGTRAQLEAEGLIPDGFQWPHRVATAEWTAGLHLFNLRRAQQGVAPWAEGDYWALMLWLKGGLRRSPGEREIIEKENALRRARYERSAEGQRAFCARYAAMQCANADSAFQAFKGGLLAGVSAKGARAARAGKRA